MTVLNENLDYLDMEGQLNDTITVDEYSAKVGKDKDIVTLTFMANSKLAAEDLVSWFERGYDYVLDASISDGEIEPGKYLVFVEMNRRSSVPRRIINLLEDLETLTGIKLKDWIVDIEGDEVDADEEIIRQKMILNPNEYKAEQDQDEEDLNEMRTIARIPNKPMYDEPTDPDIKNMKTLAGL